MDDRTLAGKPVRRPLQLFNDQSALTKRQNLSIFLHLTGADAAKSFITRRAAGSLRGVRGKRTFFGGIDLIAFLKLQCQCWILDASWGDGFWANG